MSRATRAPELLQLAAINAAFQTGFHNPIDDAIVAAAGRPTDAASRLDEVPYDFARKRLSVLAMLDGHALLVTKGALVQVLETCSTVEDRDGRAGPIDEARRAILDRHAAFCARGLRTLGLATKSLPGRTTIARTDEHDMTFVGFLLFADPPKAGVASHHPRPAGPRRGAQDHHRRQPARGEGSRLANRLPGRHHRQRTNHFVG